MSAAGGRRSAAKAAGVTLQRGEGMLQPGVADLLESFVIRRAAAHPIHTLRDDGVVGVRQGEPIQLDVAVVTGIGADAEAAPRARGAELLSGPKVADNDVG